MRPEKTRETRAEELINELLEELEEKGPESATIILKIIQKIICKIKMISNISDNQINPFYKKNTTIKKY